MDREVRFGLEEEVAGLEELAAEVEEALNRCERLTAEALEDDGGDA